MGLDSGFNITNQDEDDNYMFRKHHGLHFLIGDISLELRTRAEYDGSELITEPFLNRLEEYLSQAGAVRAAPSVPEKFFGDTVDDVCEGAAYYLHIIECLRHHLKRGERITYWACA